MPRYRYTSPFPAVLIGLRQGVEATVVRATGNPPPPAATIDAQPGDLIDTAQPVERPFLELIPDAAPTPASTPAPVTVPAPAPAPAAEEPAQP